MRILFARCVKSYECSDYYESKTNVYVFGDEPGYEKLAQTLKLAEKSPQVIPPDPRGLGMNCVILPACKKLGAASRIKLIERLVFLQKRPRMELVIYGTPAAYRYLAHRVLMLSAYAPDSGEYHGLDDQIYDENLHVVPRSVALTIRPPVKASQRSILGAYGYRVKNNPFKIPADIDLKLYTSEDRNYEPISASESDFLNL